MFASRRKTIKKKSLIKRKKKKKKNVCLLAKYITIHKVLITVDNVWKPQIDQRWAIYIHIYLQDNMLPKYTMYWFKKKTNMCVYEWLTDWLFYVK